jgi:hypothetical protein
MRAVVLTSVLGAETGSKVVDFQEWQKADDENSGSDDDDGHGPATKWAGWKDKGHKAFRARDFVGATDWYSKILRHKEVVPKREQGAVSDPVVCVVCVVCAIYHTPRSPTP